MEIFLLYLVSTLDDLKIVCGLISGIGSFATTIFFLCGREAFNDESKELYAKIAKRLMYITITATVLVVIVPSEKDVYKIAIGYSALNSEQALELPSNLLGAGNKFLQEYLNKE